MRTFALIFPLALLGCGGQVEQQPEQQQAQATAPDLMSSLNSMLDRNNDGSSMDDLAAIAGKFFK